MIASKLEAKDLIDVAGEHVAIVNVNRFTEDGETWIYATDINGSEYEWREDEDIEIHESNIDPYDYIEACKWCHRPAHKCICP